MLQRFGAQFPDWLDLTGFVHPADQPVQGLLLRVFIQCRMILGEALAYGAMPMVGHAQAFGSNSHSSDHAPPRKQE
jgi:hypothetical protein